MTQPGPATELANRLLSFAAFVEVERAAEEHKHRVDSLALITGQNQASHAEQYGTFDRSRRDPNPTGIAGRHAPAAT